MRRESPPVSQSLLDDLDEHGINHVITRGIPRMVLFSSSLFEKEEHLWMPESDKKRKKGHAKVIHLHFYFFIFIIYIDVLASISSCFIHIPIPIK